jgi:hypothetical protein
MMMNIPQMCAFCRGTGKDKNAPCPICVGRGEIEISAGVMETMCRYCTGSGRQGDNPCPICNGVGSVDGRGQPLIKPTIMPAPVFKLPEPAPKMPAPVHPAERLIAPERIEQLTSCAPVNLDFTKLIRMCEEANANYAGKCYAAVAMLTRAILDHVPPVFGQQTFDHVVANYAGGRSFKDAMDHLNEASRKIADALLHMPMRASEVLPTAQQVNCIQQLDALLSEIVRITPKNPSL